MISRFLENAGPCVTWLAGHNLQHRDVKAASSVQTTGYCLVHTHRGVPKPSKQFKTIIIFAPSHALARQYMFRPNHLTTLWGVHTSSANIVGSTYCCAVCVTRPCWSVVGSKAAMLRSQVLHVCATEVRQRMPSSGRGDQFN